MAGRCQICGEEKPYQDEWLFSPIEARGFVLGVTVHIWEDHIEIQCCQVCAVDVAIESLSKLKEDTP